MRSTGISQRAFFTVFILLFNALTWLYMTVLVIDSILDNLYFASTVWTVFYVAVISSSIVGSVLSNKIERLSFLYLWMALGAIASFSPVIASDLSIVSLSLSCLLLGVSLGLGMPSALSYFADSTLVENRGRIGGVIFLAANLGVFPLAIPFMIVNSAASPLILAIWRGLGLVLFLSLRPTDKYESKLEKRKQTSFAHIFQDRSFILYLAPWIMFTFIDRLGGELIGRQLEEAVIGSISALFGGFLADSIGRKRVVVYGFVLLGITYGIVGIVPTMFWSNYLYVTLDGIAAGILSVTCLLILWGDLSQSRSREKYYAVGSIPLFLTSLIPIHLSPYIALVPLNATFSIASFFLFLAVLPLIYAPETLPEKKIRLRQLQSYAEKAKKLSEKHLKSSKLD